MQDIYSRVQKLVNEIEGMVKNARNTSDIEEELKEYEIVDQVEVEPSEFSKSMERILRQAYPSGVDATPERESEGGTSKDVQEDSDATTELSVAEGDTSDIEEEDPIITGKDVEKALKAARQRFRKLSDFELLRVLRKEARVLCEIVDRLEKAASYNVALPPRTESDVVANILKRAADDADLVAEYLAAQSPEAAAAGVSAPEGVLTPEEAAEAEAELVQEVREADLELSQEIIEAAEELIRELEAAGYIPAGAITPQTLLEQLLAAGATPEEIEQAVDELAEELAEATKEFEQEYAGVVGEAPAEEEEEAEPMSDEKVVEEVGNAMEDLGLTPEELVAETEDKDEEKKEAARKIASAVKALKRSGRFRRREASKQADKKLRESVKSYLLELIS